MSVQENRARAAAALRQRPSLGANLNTSCAISAVAQDVLGIPLGTMVQNEQMYGAVANFLDIPVSAMWQANDKCSSPTARPEYMARWVENYRP